MKKKPNLVLGYFGYVTNQLDGQTVKTRDIYRLLTEQNIGVCEFFDTQEFQVNKFSILKMFYKVCQCKSLVYLPAHNNLKYIFPCIFLLSKIRGIKIDYFVVGGWLNDYLMALPLHRWMLRHINGIHVETKRLQQDLRDNYGYRHVDIFPNFRFLEATNQIKDHKCKSREGVLRGVFVSRICEAKGLDILNELYERVKDYNVVNKFTIDFYGSQTDDYYKNYMSEIPIYRYLGVLQPEDVISTLRQYDVLIFPTHYEGEGCPGIVVEALFAGLPVIASDWKYNSEFVESGINGILCEPFNVSDYENAIKQLLEYPKLLDKMSEAALKKAAEFTSETSAIKMRNILNI